MPLVAVLVKCYIILSHWRNNYQFVRRKHELLLGMRTNRHLLVAVLPTVNVFEI